MIRRVRGGGFTYIGLVVLLAILGLVAAAGIKTGSLMQRAAAEHELLEIGAEFSAALRSYAAATPRGQPPQPPGLDALLKDPRSVSVRRHLRQVYVDPLTGRAEWGLMRMGDQGGIIGVYSLSSARPLKVGNFDLRFTNFDNKERHSDWKFTAGGQGVITTAQPANPTAPGAATSSPEPAPAPAVEAERASERESEPAPPAEAAESNTEDAEQQDDDDPPKPVAK